MESLPGLSDDLSNGTPARQASPSVPALRKGPEPAMTAILVTGSTGTLGRALIPRLATAGHEVRGLSRRPRPPSTSFPAPGDGSAAAFPRSSSPALGDGSAAALPRSSSPTPGDGSAAALPPPLPQAWATG